MAMAVNTLRPCKLHCRPFGITNSQAFHCISTKPSSERTRRGALRSMNQAGLQKGWNEMDAAPLAPPCSLRSDRGEHVPSGRSLASTLALMLALGSAAYLASPGAAAAADLQHKLEHFHPVAADLNQLAESEDFWSNILRYVSYFFSVLLGTAYTAIKPIGGFLRKPVSAVITVAVIIGLYVFVSSTVNAMLGVNQDNALVLPPLNIGS
ncbi:g7719 [Coccomyxa viridis]|uniref:Uncharacterized protein ycf33 n=1 Tax=Coccomyxa viridis TaxID=1274662 RepID=A0ABP1FYK0_9CHLO